MDDIARRRQWDSMVGERNLSTLLSRLNPTRNPGSYVFCTIEKPVIPDGLQPVATVIEPEGISVVVTRDDADAYGLAYHYVAAWITLAIHSALDAVGLTASVSATLAKDGISCNMVAGYHHDHIFVDVANADRALASLRSLAEDRRA